METLRSVEKEGKDASCQRQDSSAGHGGAALPLQPMEIDRGGRDPPTAPVGGAHARVGGWMPTGGCHPVEDLVDRKGPACRLEQPILGGLYPMERKMSQQFWEDNLPVVEFTLQQVWFGCCL